MSLNSCGGLTVTATTLTNVSCFAGNNGSATVSTSSGICSFTYAWSSGATTQTATSLASGTYTVTISDNTGFTGTASATKNTPTTAVTATLILSNATIFTRT